MLQNQASSLVFNILINLFIFISCIEYAGRLRKQTDVGSHLLGVDSSGSLLLSVTHRYKKNLTALSLRVKIL